jgi:hypothetical protein
MRIKSTEADVAPSEAAIRAVNDPVALGVPDMIPVEGLKLRPVGRLPEARENVVVPVAPFKVGVTGAIAAPTCTGRRE